MMKFPVAVLTAALLAGASRADAPAQAADEPGPITRAVNQVRLVALRLKGVWLGSFVRKGMGSADVFQLLGIPENRWAFNNGGLCLEYHDLGVEVFLWRQGKAGDGSDFLVTRVSLSPVPFRMP